MPREIAFQNKVIKYAEAMGDYVFNVPGTGMERKGTADLLICHQGRFFAIELKVPGETPSRLQQYELDRVRKAGGVAVFIQTMEELEALLK